MIIGGGPAGYTAASTAARYGAQVTLIEAEVVGGGANLRDCVPSKTMIATGNAMLFSRRSETMGIADHEASVDTELLRARIEGVTAKLSNTTTQLLTSQNVRIIRGRGVLKDSHTIAAETENGIEEIPADVILLSTGSRPAHP